MRRKNKKTNHGFCHNRIGREREGEEREERKEGAKKENRTNIKPKKRGHCEEFQDMKGIRQNFKNQRVQEEISKTPRQKIKF